MNFQSQFWTTLRPRNAVKSGKKQEQVTKSGKVDEFGVNYSNITVKITKKEKEKFKK